MHNNTNYQCKICWNKALTFGVGSIQLSFRIYHCVHPIHANMFSIQMLLHFSQIVPRVCTLVLSFNYASILLYIHTYNWKLYLDIIRQYNTINLNSSHFKEKKLLRWDLKPRHMAYEADALPTELPRQLSWLGQIKCKRQSV